MSQPAPTLLRGRPLSSERSNIIAGKYWLTDPHNTLPMDVWRQLQRQLGVVPPKPSDKACRLAVAACPELLQHWWHMGEHASFMFVSWTSWRSHCVDFNSTLAASHLREHNWSGVMILLSLPCGVRLHKATLRMCRLETRRALLAEARVAELARLLDEQMTEEKAREILGGWTTPTGEIEHKPPLDTSCQWRGTSVAGLWGTFTSDKLRAIAWWMDNMKIDWKTKR